MSDTRPTIKPGFKNRSGYWHDPTTSCCGAYVVYESSLDGIYVRWHGYEGSLPKSARCEKCDNLVKIK